MRKQVISFTIEPELEEYLKRMAGLDHVSVSQYLRNILWAGYEIERHKDEAVQLPNGVRVNIAEKF